MKRTRKQQAEKNQGQRIGGVVYNYRLLGFDMLDRLKYRRSFAESYLKGLVNKTLPRLSYGSRAYEDTCREIWALESQIAMLKVEVDAMSRHLMERYGKTELSPEKEKKRRSQDRRPENSWKSRSRSGKQWCRHEQWGATDMDAERWIEKRYARMMTPQRLAIIAFPETEIDRAIANASIA